jgi:HEAT repeat protein
VDAVLGSEVAIELLGLHPDHEGIAAAALLVVQDPMVLGRLARHAQSKDAHVRENYAEACGRLGGLGEIAQLVRLLGDRVWWVRYRAAQALFRLKGMDAAGLEAVRAGLTDPFARDMFDQVRAEVGGR